MKKLRLLLLILAFCLVLPASGPRAQEEEANAAEREADESATSVEARQRALTTLLEDARRLRNGGKMPEAARALNRAGRFHLKLNLPEDALATFQEALTITRETPHAALNIDSLNGLGAAYNRLSKCAEAQTFLQQAITLSEQNNYPAGKAEALLTLSQCQNYSDHALALRTAQEALALWQSVGRKRGVAQSYVAVGEYQLAQNNLTEAARSYETALNLWRELNVASEQAEMLISLGFVEYRKGAWQNVFTFLTQAQNLLDEKAEPYKMGQITSGMAEAFVESGLPEIGLDKYSEALEYYRQAQNPRAVIVTIWAVGKAYYLLDKYPEALDNLQRALADAESIKEPTIVAMCNDFLGRTFSAMNDRVAALRHFEIALDLYTRVGNPMEAARVRALMGQVYQQQGKAEKAREYYQNALEAFRSLSDLVNQSATLYARGSLELEQNNLDVAEDYLRQSIEATENMRRVSTSRDLTAAFSARVHERYQNYIECLMRKHQIEPAQGFAVRALEANEAARGRSLAELLRATETNLVPGLDPELGEREKSLRQSLKVKEDYKVALLGRDYKKEELAALELELTHLEAEYKQVIEIIQARYPSYEQITRPVAWDLQRIQKEVIADDQTVLLEYSLGADRSYVWAVTHNSITSYELPARELINEAAEKVYKLLATPPGADTENEFTPAVQELSRMVLSPVAKELNKRRIIVVADGALHYIPFQILPAPSANNEPLVDSVEVVNTPSASILGELQLEAARRQPATKMLAAFGDPVFLSNYALRKGTNDNEQVAAIQPAETERPQRALRGIEIDGDSFDSSTIQPLHYARREITNLRAVVAGEIFVAMDFAATRKELLNADLTQYAILHLATHGYLDPKLPGYSGLLLSTVDRNGQTQDGFVSLQDIYQLRAPVNLVVLSACQTALGQEVRGEGLIGVTRGFMYAGASTVVASLWKVDDEATADLMKRFYSNMQDGMTPAAALRAAQNSARQEGRPPYYWAAFTLQGEFRQVIKPIPKSAIPAYMKIVVGVTLLMLLTGVAWWYRRRRLRRVQG
jgi:CHAT domain-containing protein/tetratricopeptide (TPR) repeat protein